ncbi:MAG: hypothetical protein WC890_04665 [Candidatus Margulisiibacteriota bacterium]
MNKSFPLFLAFFIICNLILQIPSVGWVITKDLKAELKQKNLYAKQHPNDPEAQFELAITQGYTNNLIDGMSSLKKVNNIDPTFKTKALNVYFKRVLENPNDWKVRFRMAFVYYFNDKKESAIREFNNVLILDPYNVWAYGYMALLYGDMGQIDKAIALTKKGLSIDSNVAALHLLLGEGYAKKGNGSAAMSERIEAFRLRALGY